MEANKDQQLTYPRSTIICPDCHDTAILSRGEARTLSMRHVNVGNNINPCAAQGLNHIRAKELLQAHLIKGGKILIRSTCFLCHRTKATNYYMQAASSIVLEHRYNNSIFDVASVLNDNIVFGVEIYNTSKSNNIHERSNIAWFKVDVDQVLDGLNVIECSRLLYLDDKRNDVGTKCVQCQSVQQYTIQELAVELGYKTITSAYPTESRKLLDCCAGCYTCNESWNTRGKTNDILRLQFVAKQQCLKCLRRYETGKFKPFCVTCYKNIEDEPNAQIEIEVGNEEKNRCIKLFRWLDDIPGDYSYGVPCAICQRNYTTDQENELYNKYRQDSNYVKGYTWWFGGKKRCCTVCLEARYQNSLKLS